MFYHQSNLYVANIGRQDKVEIRPKHLTYELVQMDECYSFVSNKNKKVWILYAYCTKSKEILALAMDKRSKTIKDLAKRMKISQ